MRAEVPAPPYQRRHSRPLLERERELAALEAALTTARAGGGGIAVIEGPPGIGKSRLLAAACEMASGFTVLRARGGELERDFPWGVVRQLFETELLRGDADRRQMLLAGAAASATEPLGLPREAVTAGVADPGDASFAALHGLYWLAVNLTAERPLLLAVDDLQWVDAPSLRFLLYLTARVEELPLLIVTAVRPTAAGAAHEVIAQATAAMLLRPEALTEPAVGSLITEALAPAQPRFVAACHRASGGNPFLIAELLAQLRVSGVAPLDDQAARVEQLAPPTVARAVLRRLARLAHGADALAHAVAVLGTDVQVRHAAAVAGLSGPVAADAADALAVAEVLRPGRPLEFVHPIVRAAVRDDLPAGQRIALHRRAAEILLADGAAPERVGVHLLGTDPGGLAWVVTALRDAAEAARSRGAPDAAAEFLRRALAEPPREEARPGLLRMLGRCALLAGDDTGAEHYRAAIAATGGPGERAAIARELGVIHVPPGGYVEAVATLERAVADARTAGDGELAVRIEADLLTAGRLHPATLAATLIRAEEIDPDTVEATPAGRCLLSSLALHGVIAGWPLSRVTAVARRAAAGELTVDATMTNTLWDCGFALSVADDLPGAQRWWQAILAQAQAQGSILTFARCSCFLAMTAQRGGELPAAEAHARASLGATEGQRWFLRRMATAALIEALVERGALSEAQAALTAVDGDGELVDAMMINFLLFARGRLRVTCGERESGLADLREYGRRPGCPMRDNPAVRPWRSEAALVELALGRGEDARRLATEELELARALGSDRVTGVALRALGLCEGGRRGEQLLGEAVAVLAGSPARLEHARALVDLGAAIRRSGRRIDSRAPLSAGLDLAHRCGARALAERALVELRAAGARPRRPRSSGVDALTASERRVAEMAAGGMTNREIAQALFVTLRTIEVHLTHAYTKLAVSSRTELPSALSGERAPPIDRISRAARLP